MDQEQHGDKDLRVDMIMTEGGRSYRATHIPSGVFAESNSVREAIDTVNAGLEVEQ